MKKDIPSASEFILNKQKDNNVPPTPQDVEQWMIEFAKIHCEKQAKVISDKVLLSIDGVTEKSNGQRYIVDEGNHYSETEIDIDKDSILNAYSLNNIV